MMRSKLFPNEGLVPLAGFGLSLSLMVTDSPGCTVRVYQNAHLVPACSGFTVAAPLTTWSLMPSFGYAVTDGQLNSRPLLVSFSQNSGLGAVPSAAVSATSSSGPRKGWSMSTPPPPASFRDGFAESSQDHVLRNHAV